MSLCGFIIPPLSSCGQVVGMVVLRDLGCVWHWPIKSVFLLFSLFLLLLMSPIVLFGTIHESHYTILATF